MQRVLERSPRVLFVGRSIGHFSYYESIISALLDRGAHVELVLDRDWSERREGASERSALDEFVAERPELKTDWIVRRDDAWRETIFALRELRSYRSYLTRKETTPFYVRRWRVYLAPPWRARSERRWFRRLLRSSLADFSLRGVEALVPADRGIMTYLREKRPDVLLTSPLNLCYSEETDYVKAARALGIPTLLPVYSWDNLSTKGLIHIVPDMVCVWNEFQHHDALEIQKVPRSRLKVTGSSFFDKWFVTDGDHLDRDEFLRSLSFDPAGRLLLYLGSSVNIAKDESWFVEAVKDVLEKSDSPVLRSFNILVRPHPAHSQIYQRLDRPGIKVWPENGALPERRQDFADMRNSFFHADAALGINTSGMIDSVLANLPTFSVRLPQYSETQSDAKHFRQLVAADAIDVEPGIEEFVAKLDGILHGSDAKAQQRHSFAVQFARPNGPDRSAGEIIAELALALAK